MDGKNIGDEHELSWDNILFCEQGSITSYTFTLRSFHSAYIQMAFLFSMRDKFAKISRKFQIETICAVVLCRMEINVSNKQKQSHQFNEGGALKLKSQIEACWCLLRKTKHFRQISVPFFRVAHRFSEKITFFVGACQKFSTQNLESSTRIDLLLNHIPHLA